MESAGTAAEIEEEVKWTGRGAWILRHDKVREAQTHLRLAQFQTSLRLAQAHVLLGQAHLFGPVPFVCC